MKKLLSILMFMLFLSVYSQEGKAWAWDVEGKVLSALGSESINDVFKNCKSEYQMFSTDIGFKSEDGHEYNIIYQKFSHEPLFLAKSEQDMSESQVKRIPQIIAEFKRKNRSRDVRFEKNYLLEYDIKEAIEKKITDSWFLNALGKPDNSYKSSRGFKSYRYESSNMAIIFIFNNGVITDYTIHGGL